MSIHFHMLILDLIIAKLLAKLVSETKKRDKKLNHEALQNEGSKIFNKQEIRSKSNIETIWKPIYTTGSRSLVERIVKRNKREYKTQRKIESEVNLRCKR